MDFTPSDLSHMQHALRLARRMLGQTCPNPAVGCVVVSAAGQIVGVGHTARGGRPHAEAVALAQAGELARGGAAYVTLEPCAHHGKTPPCAEALIAAGVARVVYACADPDARVDGKGAAMLRGAGVAVEQGLCAKEVEAALYTGFFRRVRENMPFVTLKIATSLDGKIANAQGVSQWITGEESRRAGHCLRVQHEAILTGIGTVLADNPKLDCRIAGLEGASPIRVVLDRRLRIPLESRLVQTAKTLSTWVCCAAAHATLEKTLALKEKGVEVIAISEPDMPLVLVLEALAARGVSSALIEAGQGVSSHALESGLVDELHWFRAPFVMGEGGMTAFTGDAQAALAKRPRFSGISRRQLGVDMLDVYQFHKAE